MIHIFIINNFAGNKRLAKDLRKHLDESADFRYFVFNTVRAGFEEDIVRKIIKYFEGEKLRFYCCGGSGTMRNMLQGFDNLNDIEVAFFPCGLTNDYIKSFGRDGDKFYDIDNLIYGKVVPVDYIKTNHGTALNTFSMGIDSRIVYKMNEYRVYDVFGGQVPYFMALISGIMHSNTRKLEVKINGEIVVDNFSEIIYGNGSALGGSLYFTPRTDLRDGKGSYILIANRKRLRLLPILFGFMNKKHKALASKSRMGETASIEIRALDGKPISINLDGELVEGEEYWKAEIVRKGLKLVVPKDIEIKPLIYKGKEACHE